MPFWRLVCDKNYKEFLLVVPSICQALDLLSDVLCQEIPSLSKMSLIYQRFDRGYIYIYIYGERERELG